MDKQEAMFSEIEAWYSSGKTKNTFIKGKPYTEAKFNYWLKKWKSHQSFSLEEGFSEISTSMVESKKVLEIESGLGIKITVFA